MQLIFNKFYEINCQTLKNFSVENVEKTILTKPIFIF